MGWTCGRAICQVREAALNALLGAKDCKSWLLRATEYINSMNWRPFIALLILLFGNDQLLSQSRVDTTGMGRLRQRMEADTLGPRWLTTGVFNVNLNQVSLTNWAAGGASSVSGITMFNGQANWQKGRAALDNTLVLAFGGQKQQERPSMKTEDRIELLSKYGYRLSDIWYLATLVQVRTQFTEGFDQERRRISHFLAPGYVVGGVGVDHRPSDRFSTFLSPATARLIVVTDPTLWDVSDDPGFRVYGVPRGQSMALEFGAFFRLQYSKVLAPNINFVTRGDLFTNYLRNPGNINVNWETLWTFKVNEWFAATLNTMLIYDHDVQLPRTNDAGETYTAPATQFKQTLGIGITFKL